MALGYFPENDTRILIELFVGLAKFCEGKAPPLLLDWDAHTHHEF